MGACRINPTGEMYFDGTTLGPYDVLFVKLKRLMLEGRTAGTTNAVRYGNWMSASVRLWLCLWHVSVYVTPVLCLHAGDM